MAEAIQARDSFESETIVEFPSGTAPKNVHIQISTPFVVCHYLTTREPFAQILEGYTSAIRDNNLRTT
jgi:hypothetical protein